MSGLGAVGPTTTTHLVPAQSPPQRLAAGQYGSSYANHLQGVALITVQ